MIEGFIHFYKAALSSLVFCLIHLAVVVFILEREEVTKMALVWNWVSLLASFAFAIWLFIDGMTATVWIVRNSYSSEYAFLLVACNLLAISGCVFARRFFREVIKSKENRDNANGLKY